jgi:hypothetical protein
MKALIIFVIFFTLLAAGCRVKDSANELQVANADSLINLGNEITQATFESLRGELQKALQDGGIENALRYCNVKAVPLTDSLSRLHDVSLVRISNKNRNPDNSASNFETELINRYEEEIENRVPQLIKSGNAIIYYKPIIAQAMCLNCHGTPGESLLLDNHSLIKSLYPNDKAIDYREGNVRGLWKIVFTNN